jgi:hypothetical protein
MKASERRCANCNSRRRSVYRAGFCAKCYYWHRKAGRLKRGSEGKADSLRARSMSVPERVLQEYAWRERHLNAPDVDPLVIEQLVYAVTAECRSEIGFSVSSFLTEQSPKARRCMYALFLAIVENTPCSLPRLGMWRPPRKGQYWDGWAEWSTESRHARFNA